MGAAMDLDMSERLVEVEVPSDQGQGTIRAYVPCESCCIELSRNKTFTRTRIDAERFWADDKLVIAVGSTSNDHGVKGLEHCFQLKTIPDAQAIRRRIMSMLELDFLSPCC